VKREKPGEMSNSSLRTSTLDDIMTAGRIARIGGVIISSV
jgi:hypothetical protein